MFTGGAEQAQRSGATASDIGASYAEQAKAQMGSAADSAAYKAQQAKEAAGGYAEGAKQTLYGAGDAAAARAAEAKDSAAETAHQATEHAGGIFEAVRLPQGPCIGTKRPLTRDDVAWRRRAGQGEAGGACSSRRSHSACDDLYRC